MCKFCEPLNDNHDFIFDKRSDYKIFDEYLIPFMYLTHTGLEWGFDLGRKDVYFEKVEFKFCPMCGRSLGGDAE